MDIDPTAAPLALWETNPDRGMDGILRTEGPGGQATVAQITAEEDSPMLRVWTGPPQGRAPVRLHDPSGGDPARVIAELLASPQEAIR